MLEFLINLHFPKVVIKFLIFLLTFSAQLLYLQTFQCILIRSFLCQEYISKCSLSQLFQKIVASHHLQLEVFILHYLPYLLKLVFDCFDFSAFKLVKCLQGLKIGFGRLNKMANIEERAKQLRGKDSLEYFSIFLERANIPQQPEQKHSKLVKCLRLILLIDIIKLNHVAVDRMRANQQQNSVFKPIFNILGAHIIVKHQMSQNFYVVNRLLIVQRLSQLQADQVSEIRKFEVIDNLCFCSEKQSINAAKKCHLEQKVPLCPLKLSNKCRCSIYPSKILIKLSIVKKILNDPNKLRLMRRLQSLQSKDQPSHVPHFLEHFAEPTRDQLTCDLQNDLSCFRIIHRQQVHDLAEHFMCEGLRAQFDESKMQGQDFNQNGRRVRHFRQKLIQSYQKLWLQQCSKLCLFCTKPKQLQWLMLQLCLIDLCDFLDEGDHLTRLFGQFAISMLGNHSIYKFGLL